MVISLIKVFLIELSFLPTPCVSLILVVNFVLVCCYLIFQPLFVLSSFLEGRNHPVFVSISDFDVFRLAVGVRQLCPRVYVGRNLRNRPIWLI
jgi:hypothetical protein